MSSIGLMISPHILAVPGHATERVDWRIVHRHQLRDRFSAFGDDDWCPLLSDLIHQTQTVRLETRRRNTLKFAVHFLVTMSLDL
jgi:hypothetical protein